MKLMNIFILLSVLLLAATYSNSQSVSNQPVNSPAKSNQTKKVNESEAVKIAEKFIIENGYTDLPATNDKTKIVFESIEWTSETEKLLKSRRNTLQKKAYGILKGGKNDAEGFTVVFLNVDGLDKKTGRAVNMDSKGKNLRVEHQNILLKAVQKKL